MPLTQKILRLIFRYTILISLYILYKFCVYQTITVKRGVVVKEGRFRFENKGGVSFAYYPVVAFVGPVRSGRGLRDPDYTLPDPDRELDGRPDTGNIYLTVPPSDWNHFDRAYIGDSMDYYYAANDFAHAKVYSIFWFSNPDIYLLIIAGIIWTVIADLYRIGQEDKKRAAMLGTGKEE